MEPKRSPQVSSFLVKVASTLVFLYILFLLGKAVWSNYDLRQSIRKLNDQIATLELQKKQRENLNLYYSSDSYKELEARRKLGLKKAGEKLAIISPTTDQPNFQEALDQNQQITLNVDNQKDPNWILWLKFFTAAQVE